MNPNNNTTNAEAARLAESEGNPDGWRDWGAYLSERAWGTVREDYSADGSAWGYFPHDHARSRAYRWNEDGLGGVSDIRQNICFAVALWNGVDPILKERLFGLTGEQGNHGEDVKELYYYLDATPTASYLKFLYKYPQTCFPYADLVQTNARRAREEWEYELTDTGAFADNRYFDVFVEYAKSGTHDLCVRITAHNRGDKAADIHLLPTLWFRNTWAWDDAHRKPSLCAADAPPGTRLVAASHPRAGDYHLYAETAGDAGEPTLLFTENETNSERLFGSPNASPFVKDGINNAVVRSDGSAVNGSQTGTKVSAHYRASVAPGTSVCVQLRLKRVGKDAEPDGATQFGNFVQTFDQRIAEADAFYAPLTFPSEGGELSADAKNVQRQAYAGLIWSKQFYHFDVSKWLSGDPKMPPPPTSRTNRRNYEWKTLSAADVLSLPDKWEYPWFAAWDLAFHMIPFAQVDPDFAKHQLLLLCREWYMHPSGQLPAYEWAFGDVNPPVHAWAALRVYKIERKMRGKKRGEPGDISFLKQVFQKLLINFTWWVNRKDDMNNNVFEGGFLGLDNIGVFDRSAPLPYGGTLEQADGTAWMAMYCLNMLAIALELARVDPDYEAIATKFAEHYVYIAYAMNTMSADNLPLWDEEDGFYYDLLHLPRSFAHGGTEYIPLKVRSWVGIMPLFAVEGFDAETLAAVPNFRRRFEWFLKHRPELAQDVAHIAQRGQDERALFSLVSPERLRRLLRRTLDETEFLSPHGIRSVSKFHEKHPYKLTLDGTDYGVEYTPGESITSLFGGNSNWRGPVWFPLNYLLIESLQKFDFVYGDSLTVEMPTGSGQQATLWEVSMQLSRRLNRLFLQSDDGTRPIYGGETLLQTDPHFRDLVLFHEYFHGDNGAGLGASHQTGWTALVAKMLSQSGE